ncbi:lysophospholipase [Singulisphaera acidiphila DSM 18658]|uniref:Lysophospholipase n=1 Tax=Singulisphaera acidiphila (strain ATCC BAA-1392 / DSM 18658 / VKM B-2454 / MOB10) TaxID=886293 RepID=L0DG58_SINAD|nr:lysophospholipase [Singulisphaera acidiphila DSM 18658]
MSRLLGPIRTFVPRAWGRSPAPSLRWRLWLVVAICGLLATSGGCVSIGAHEASLRNILEGRRERVEAARYLSAPTGVFLTGQGLVDMAANDPGATARVLETRLEAQPEPGGALALAELSYREGLRREAHSPATALPWYRDAAACAALALAEPAGLSSEHAIATHNLALKRLIRISQADGVRGDGSWREVLGGQGLALVSSTSYLHPAQLADLKVADDLRVTGMHNVYRSSGLGVPVVAHRLAGPTETTDPQDQFLPRETRTGATAVLLPEGGLYAGQWRRRPASLYFADPFGAPSLPFGENDVSLATDRTTPLADQVARVHLDQLEWAGLFHSSFKREGVEAGLYMLRPYEPGKIPVVLVHGLFSSPRAYVQTINELSNTPLIASKYQFWVFIYPTGLPIPASAAKLRMWLTRARETLDPGHTDAAFDQMVLVGHSMGGLLSKMMVQDPGLELWNSTIRIPHDRFKFSPKLHETLEASLIFRPLPFVRRIVFIASPHRGSPLASDLFGRTISRLVGRPDELAESIKEIEALNGPRVIAPEMRGRTPNAIANLQTDSPVLATLDRVPIAPNVPYHSIIPQILKVSGTDGVVLYNSSHLDGAASELIVEGNHSSQQKPEVTQELRRILLEHVGSIEAGSGPVP